MYIPNHFRMRNMDDIIELIRNNGFGILITADGEQPLATHLPFFYDSERHALFAHMARANTQWRHLDGQTVLVIFSGPHAYISSEWYQLPEMVPTWNYTAVHVYGKANVIDDEDKIREILDKLVAFYDPGSRLPEQAHDPFYETMLKGIVGFRIDITDIQGAAKMSQNKPLEARLHVVEKLKERGTNGDYNVAESMVKELKRAGDERSGETV